MGKLGLIKGQSKNDFLYFIYKTIISINPDITIVVPTATLDLARSKDYFDKNKTRSFKMGAFSEFIRNLSAAKRSLHPLWSLSSIGPLADFITSNVSKHGYDGNSAFSRIFQIKNCHYLSLGNHPRFMLPVIHYLENKHRVTYRFKKSFKLKFLSKKKIIEDEFF